MAEERDGRAGHPGKDFFFVSDLHGREDRYATLLTLIAAERPRAVLLGGDLLPSGAMLFASGSRAPGAFLDAFLLPGLRSLAASLKSDYPAVFLILGNDDPRSAEEWFQGHEAEGLWRYVHMRCEAIGPYQVFGYSCVPPTPFLLKDWERYDVSRFVDPGCVPPEEGRFSTAVADEEKGLPTIQDDLRALTANADLANGIFLFHSPPYQTALDRAALDNRQVDGVPLDVHVGSIAIRRFIEERQPLVTLHGHVHESARLTCSWHETIGATHCFSAAHDGPELAVVTFSPEDPSGAERCLL
jgi:Icc-related predicted phosphoesterase